MNNEKKVKTKEIFYEELCKRFPNNSIEIIKYTKASGPIEYKCLFCGIIYKKSRANHLYENKTLCQKCYSGRTSKMRENFLQELEKSNFDLLDNPNKAISEKFHIQCKNCGREYDYKLQKRDNQKISCRFCGANGYTVDKIEFERRMKEKNIQDFEIIQYKNMTNRVVVKHSCSYIFSILPANFLLHPCCPKCSPKRSKGEIFISNYLENKGIKFISQFRFQEGSKLSYDFYLPEHNLLIEYQGQQHYEPVEHFGGEEKFRIQQERDKKKRKMAQEKNIELLEISYLDYDKIQNILEGSTTIPNGSKTKRSEVESIRKDEDIV